MELRKNKKTKKVFSNSIMMSGKSHLSEKLVKDFFKGMQKKTKKDCVIVFKLALKNTLTPVSHVTIKKRKKQKSFIPFFLLKKKRIPKVIKQICSNISKFKFEGNLFLNEIIKLANNKGVLKNTLKSTNNVSFFNKNFAHFRWF